MHGNRRILGRREVGALAVVEDGQVVEQLPQRLGALRQHTKVAPRVEDMASISASSALASGRSRRATNIRASSNLVWKQQARGSHR